MLPIWDRDPRQASDPALRPHVCELRLDPRDKFTRVVPPHAPTLRADANLVVITVNYNGFTPAAQAAFAHAVGLWQNLLTSTVPIVVNANFRNLGPTLLGTAVPNSHHQDFPSARMAGILYPAALANKLAGVDLNPGVPEITTNFNNTASWYYGTDGMPPSGQVDFVTVALHELAHGLGFLGSAAVEPGTGHGTLGLSGVPLAYDAHVVTGAGTRLIDPAIFPRPSATLGTALVHPLFWDGTVGVFANHGLPPPLYSPPTFVAGASYSHLDESTYPAGHPDSLMTPFIGTAEAIHSPGAVALGMLVDQGWTAALPPCTYTVAPSSVNAPAEGLLNAIVTVLAPPGCSWSATSNSPAFIAITGGETGVGSGVVSYSVTPNSSSVRVGTMTIAGQTVTVTQGAAPTMAVDRAMLRFGAITSGLSVVAQTGPQFIRITQNGQGSVAWTAAPTQPWLVVMPASGVGSATLTVSIAPFANVSPAGVSMAEINVTFVGAVNSPAVVTVALTTMPAGSSARAVGAVDTPLDHQVNLSGSVPFTGWALDDVQVSFVAICRAAVPPEIAPIDPLCGGLPQVFVGFAAFVEGARSDVAELFADYPLSARAGWGFMLLTNMLPNQGNGTYVFQVWAQDAEGHPALLGTRTLHCNNAAATQPFGTIDTPATGSVVSGTHLVNFGWVLTPLPKTIPFDGSTITVFVDGVPIGPPSYNHFRADIASLFPGLNNSNGAVGFRVLDTTALANGTHTIAWVAADDSGAAQGIGSRYFTVSNNAPSTTASAVHEITVPLMQAHVDALPLDRSGVGARQGWGVNTPIRTPAVGRDGRIEIDSEELDRVEVVLRSQPDRQYSSYLRSAGGLAALPIGARLDPSTGVFTWAPGVGFIGTYDFVFVLTRHGRALARQEIRVVLHPKGSLPVRPPNP